MPKRKARDPRERLMEKVVIEPNGCWMFQSSNPKLNPYGCFTLSTGRPMSSHRASWIMHYGEILPGMVVCHKCDRPGCVNPAHLFLGTNSDNINDCIRKGRGNRYKGNKCAASVLTEDQVLAIRRLYGKMSCKAVGDMYGMSVQAIANIWSGHNWSHLGPVSGWKSGKNHLSKEKAAKILSFALKSGLSTRKVGKVFNVSGETVRVILKKGTR